MNRDRPFDQVDSFSRRPLGGALPCGERLNGAVPAAVVLVGALMAVITLGGDAVAQARVRPRLTAQYEQTPVARSDAPVRVVWQLRWTGTELLEGRLEITLRDSQQRLGRVRSEPLVLSTGRRTLQTTLPAIPLDQLVSASGSGGRPQVTLDVVFIKQEDGRRIDLGEFPLPAASHQFRRFAVCLCAPSGRSISALSMLSGGLRLERFNPDRNDRSLSTAIANLPPDRMPEDPLAYCGYNIVLLAERGFTSLRAKQLEAVLEWVQAGGSLCVVPPTHLREFHADFLNRLARPKPGEDRYLLDSDGRLLGVPAGSEPRIRLMHRGLGRVAVVLAGPQAGIEPDSAEWRRTAAFLWNVRSDRVPEIVQSGNWSPVRVRGGGYAAVMTPYSYRPISEGNWLLERLRPESVEVVPLSLLGLILLAYVLVIGPVDYLLLGALRIQKFTWVLFPAVTVGFTAFTVWLSHWYMQPSEQRRTVQFLDVGEEGEIVRRSRFEMLFTGTPRRIETEVETGIFSPLNHQRFRRFDQYGYWDNSAETRLVDPPEYAGRLPDRYVVRQEIPQWTPQVNRLTEIAPEMEETRFLQEIGGFDWDGFDRGAAAILENGDRQRELREQVQAAFGPDAAVWLLHRRRSLRLAGDGNPFARQGSARPDPYVPQPTMPVPVEEAPSTPSTGDSDFLWQTCIRPASGLFSRIARIAPTGGDNFEDLALLDPSDPNQWLLVIVVERGDDLLIYRKLYTDSSP